MQVLDNARFLFKQDDRKYLEVASNGPMVPVSVSQNYAFAVNKLQKSNISCFQIEQTAQMSEACLSAHLQVRSLCN